MTVFLFLMYRTCSFEVHHATPWYIMMHLESSWLSMHAHLDVKMYSLHHDAACTWVAAFVGATCHSSTGGIRTGVCFYGPDILGLLISRVRLLWGAATSRYARTRKHPTWVWSRGCYTKPIGKHCIFCEYVHSLGGFVFTYKTLAAARSLDGGCVCPQCFRCESCSSSGPVSLGMCSVYAPRIHHAW